MTNNYQKLKIVKHFEGMSTDELVEWAEANPEDKRLYLILRIITARKEKAREEINRIISELGTKVKDYMDKIEHEIPTNDKDGIKDNNVNNDHSILIDEI